MASTVTERLEYVAGFMVLSANKQGGWQFSNIAWNFGADLQVQENGKWVSKLNSPELLQHWNGLKNQTRKQCLAKRRLLSYNDWWSKIGQETLAMCIVGSDAIAHRLLTWINRPIIRMHLFRCRQVRQANAIPFWRNPYMFRQSHQRTSHGCFKILGIHGKIAGNERCGETKH